MVEIYESLLYPPDVSQAEAGPDVQREQDHSDCETTASHSTLFRKSLDEL